MSSDDDVDYSEIQSALGSIGLSAALIFGATLLSQGLGFLTRVTMTRYLPVDGYGNIVIGLSVLNLFGIVALVGMPDALSRYLPRQGTDDERRTILSSAFQIVLFISTTLAIVIYFAAEPVATLLFENADLTWIIRIFAGVLPFYAILQMSIGGFRGYETTYPRILTQNVLRPSLQLAGIVLFVMLGYGETGVAFAYASAFGIVAVVGLGLLYWATEFGVRDVVKLGSTPQYRELLVFSLPLAASGTITVITKHSDLILLGIFKSSSSVGVYEVSFRMAIFAYLLFTPAVGYLFQPIISRFESDGEQQKMDKLYTVATRWILFASFPAFALFFLFPEQTLVFFFGEGYQAGKPALRILLVGFVISLLPGLPSMFLTATGETKMLMYISVATLGLNLIANVVLIPIYGIIGAAVATSVSRIFNNLFQSFYIYRNHDIHPFTRQYVTSIIFIGLIWLTTYIIPIRFDDLTFVEGILTVGAISALFTSLLLVSRSLYTVELKLIDIFLERIGIPISLSDHLEPFTR